MKCKQGECRPNIKRVCGEICFNGDVFAVNVSTKSPKENTYGKYTKIAPDTYIYSEYYPNKIGQFRGTIVFENGGGTDISEWRDTKNNKLSVVDCSRELSSLFMYDRSGIGKSNPDLRVSIKNPITAEKTICLPNKSINYHH